MVRTDDSGGGGGGDREADAEVESTPTVTVDDDAEVQEETRCELVFRDGSLFLKHLKGKDLKLNGVDLSLTGSEVKLGVQDRIGFGRLSVSAESQCQPVLEKFALSVVDNACLQRFLTPTPELFFTNSRRQSLEQSESFVTSDCSMDSEGEGLEVDSFDEALFEKSCEKKCLQEICSYLSLEDLKSVRLVSKKWKSASKSAFLDISSVALQPPEGMAQDWDREFSEYSANVVSYGHKNFKICYTGHPSDSLLEEDILHFLRKNGSQVQSMDLTVMPGRNDLDFIKNVLCWYSPTLDNLKELSLTLVSNTSEYNGYKYCSGSKAIPSSAKFLSIHFAFLGDDDDEEGKLPLPPEYLLNFTPLLINLFPNIVKLELAGASDEGSSQCLLETLIFGKITEVLQQFLSDQASQTPATSLESWGFSNLREIGLQWANKEVLDLLIDFPNKLKSIEVRFARNEIDTGRLQSLVDSHAEMLEKINITVMCEEDKELPIGEPQVDLSRCEWLKAITYAIYLGDNREGVLEISDVDLLGIGKILRAGPTEMKETFPHLFALEVQITPQSKELFHALYPTADFTFEQIRLMKTSYPLINLQPDPDCVQKIINLFTDEGFFAADVTQEWQEETSEEEEGSESDHNRDRDRTYLHQSESDSDCQIIEID